MWLIITIENRNERDKDNGRHKIEKRYQMFFTSEQVDGA